MAQLGRKMALASNGQQAQRQYGRKRGQKSWRASHPPTEEEKREGREFANDFALSFDLAALTLDGTDNRLRHELEEVVKGGEQYAGSATRRLRLLASSIAARRRMLQFGYLPSLALTYTETRSNFISTFRNGVIGDIEIFRNMPCTRVFAKGELSDDCELSDAVQMRFSSSTPRRKWRINMSPACLTTCKDGQIMEGDAKQFWSAMLPHSARPCARQMQVGRNLLHRLFDASHHINRGNAHTAMCVAFRGDGPGFISCAA